MTEVKITSLIKLYTILLLSEKPKHGYELIKRVGEKTGKKISPGEIYPFLKQLKKQGYITVKSVEERGKKIYYLTAKGKLFVKRMLDRFGDLIGLAVEPKITACTHCGCKIYEGGHKEKIKGKKLTFCCHHCAKSFMSKAV